MIYEKSCGAVVFRRFHGNIEILLIQHNKGRHWSFPKGHVEPGESEIETAIREIHEETGIKVALDQTFRKIVTYSPFQNTTKDVIYFVARAVSFDITPQLEEISNAKWVQLDAAKKLITFDNDKQILNSSVPYLK